MKKLFKSSLRGFWKAKVGMILLSITVFITTFIFTLFYSTANSFNKSYDNVVTKGKLHDFTVKEKYSVTGKVGENLTTNGKTSKQVGTTNIPYTADAEYIYLTNNIDGIFKRDNKAIAPGPKSTYTLRIPRKNLVLTDSSGDGSLDSVAFSNPYVSIALHGSDYVLHDPWNGQEVKWSTPVKINDNGQTKITNQNEGFLGTNYDYYLATTSRLELGKKVFTFLQSKNLIGDLYSFNIGVNTTLLKPTDGLFGLFSEDGTTISKAKTDAIVQAALGTGSIVNVDKAVVGADPQKWITDGDGYAYPEIADKIKQLNNYIETQGTTIGHKSFVSEVENKYGNELYISKTLSTVVASGGNIFKVTNGANNKNVDQLVMFSGDKPSPTYDVYKKQTLKEKVNSFIEEPEKKHIQYNDKGYKIVASWAVDLLGHALPHTVAYTDPSSMQATISSDYAKHHRIKPVSAEKVWNDVEALQESLLKKGEANDFAAAVNELINSKYKNNVVWVDNTPYFITGIGTTPDFSFPIINAANPIPNTNTQAILFTNKSGYARIYDAFRGNEHEDYLGFKFKDNVSSERRAEILNDIEVIAKRKMAWGESVNHIVSKVDDTSEKVILAPQRISFLTKLKGTISTITYITTISLLIFTAFIITMLVRKQINSNRKTYGILLANGYSKFQVALSNTSIALIIGVASTIIGYVAGQVSQYAFINIFKNYWTIPVVRESFSWVALTTTVVAPMLGISLLAFVITLWRLRGSVLNNINETDSSIAGYFASHILGPMKYIGIKSKTSLSLFISNISKMIMMLVAGTLAITAMTVSAAEIRKFDYARTESLNATNYAYKLDLITPTTEGGLMHQMPIQYTGLKDKSNNIYNINDPASTVGATNGYLGAPATAFQDKSTFHVPTQDDEKWQYNPLYLNNKIEFRAVLDVFMGALGTGANPWDLARKKMPENQANIANRQNKSFLKFIAEGNAKYLTPDGSNTLFSKKRSWYVSQFLEKSGDDWSVKTKDVVGGFLTPSVKPDFLKFLYLGFISAVYEYQNNKDASHLPYLISYRNMITDADDETYTHLDSSFKRRDISGKTSKSSFHVEGIKEGSANINLTKSAWNKLTTYKQLGSEIPVIVNQYFMEKYNLGIGDKFDATLENHKDRYIEKTESIKNHTNQKVHTVTYKIVGTQNSYNDSKLYTLKDYANKAVGWGNNPEMFNGIYTKHKNSIIFQHLPLYSVSGLYPATDTLQPSGVDTKTQGNIETVLQTKKLPDGSAWNGKAQSYDELLNIYSNSPYQIMFNNVNWSLTDAYKFDSILDLSSKLIYIMESIILALAIIFVVIITMMLISDNKRFISTLKVMGYRNAEVNRLFLGAFTPSLLIASLISAPIAIAIVYAIKVMIMSFGSILVPLVVTPWIYIAVVAFVLAIMYVVYRLSTKGIKNTNMLNAFKE